MKFKDVRTARRALKRLLPESLPVIAKWNQLEIPKGLSEQETREYIFKKLFPRARRL